MSPNLFYLKISRILLSRDIPNNDARTFTNSARKNITETMKIITNISFNIPAAFSLNSKFLLNEPIIFCNRRVTILKKISKTPITSSISIIIFIDNLNHSFPKHILKLYHNN